jgi:hypothetical protein
MERKHYILDSSATLLGVALVIVTAVHITGKSATTAADDMAFGAALLFLVACLLSHRSISTNDDKFERIADKFFASAILLLLLSALSFWF